MRDGDILEVEECRAGLDGVIGTAQGHSNERI